MRTHYMLICLIVGCQIAGATATVNPNPDKPPRLYMENDQQSLSSHVHEHIEEYLDDEQVWRTVDYDSSFSYTHHWADGSGGNGEGLIIYHAESTCPSYCTNGTCHREFSWLVSSSPDLIGG